MRRNQVNTAPPRAVATRPPVTIRRAVRADVAAIVGLLADDDRGAGRERVTTTAEDCYLDAFEQVAADPHSLLVVGERAGCLVATSQVTFIPGLSRQGAWRAQVEAVRVRASERGRGVGTELIHWVIDEARWRGCRIVQLTTDKRRTRSHRFYASLGFTSTPGGMKLLL